MLAPGPSDNFNNQSIKEYLIYVKSMKKTIHYDHPIEISVNLSTTFFWGVFNILQSLIFLLHYFYFIPIGIYLSLI
jgi:hypothetical protein